MHKLKVCELFAGVGGFRLGLETTGEFEVVWSNQWEPSTKTQHASKVYEARFGSKGHSNQDIAQVPTDSIPDHDVLVGGFPCQDYSVATTLKNAKGLIGKKGVLWWSIHRILEEKKNKPKYLIFENVDRLLKSPSKQRGRDFAIMLSSLSQLGYAVEWRVINAADYGMPQRRRRVFFVGIHKSTPLYQKITNQAAEDTITANGVLAEAFPATPIEKPAGSFTLDKDLVSLSEQFNIGGGLSPFQNSGLCFAHTVNSIKVAAAYDGPKQTLADVLEKRAVDPVFYIDQAALEKWEYLKGSKKEVRTTKDGFKYHYAEGAMVFPDAVDNASRTIITGEGGSSPSRFKHVVRTPHGLRRLTPLELERLNMFPDNHTQLDGITDTKRAFFMGNALVVGVVANIARSLLAQIQS
ncbi:Cytosine-specific methyltransferase [Croceitalea dokdonensis DOKDO 023]|uniref:Cytosine-specific methyltransferase n=1 Tax=Croceitalea dokdonensis DOKDO 023 TaxID=1300341 RepID=A0A0P7A391_9FLAO|nr:DNA (cytosine-5-)-methyltransferase [Croceitalea dokdonensis]KPM30912.1 Cytosine-specific methyltransferase [Croceitalea dokdonensis DOKDO 023]